MSLDVGREVAALGRLSVKRLREKYAEAFGEPPTGNSRPWLARRIAWRLQERAKGGLSERARARAAELADYADLRLLPPRPQAARSRPPCPGRPAAAGPGHGATPGSRPYRQDAIRPIRGCRPRARCYIARTRGGHGGDGSGRRVRVPRRSLRLAVGRDQGGDRQSL